VEELEKWKIKEFNIVGDYTIKMIFNDGKERTINFEACIGKGWMKKLKDKDYFNRVKLGHNNNLEWPDGQDFNPEALYNWEEFKSQYEE